MSNEEKINRIINGLSEALLELQIEDGSFKDPIFGFSDPRITAEISKSLFYLGKEKEALEGLDWLISQQRKDGSWNEVLPGPSPYFDDESCVATATVGRILLLTYKRTENKNYLESALKASKHVLLKEFSPGYFIKSLPHYGDILNVNATCAAFLFELYENTNDKKFIEARNRAIFNIVRFQFMDGAYPYGSPIRTCPYEYHLNVRDPHYQGITLYFLLHSDPELKNQYLKISTKGAIEWLESSLNNSGFDWSKDKLMFSIGATGAYGYAAYCFDYFKRRKAYEIIVKKLMNLQLDGLYERYESGRFSETIKGIFGELFEVNYVSNTGYPLSVKIKRIRNRLKRDLIERRNRKISLYYSAQIFDCLTELKVSK